MKRVLCFYKTLPSVFLKISILVALIISPSCLRNTDSGTHLKESEIKPVNSYAKRYQLEVMDGYSQLSVIDPWQGARNTLQLWYLVPRGNSPPDGIDTSSVIYVPVKKIMCMSTTHLAMISALEETNSVCGFSGTKFICNSDFRELVDRGFVREIGYEDNLNKEIIVKTAPDLMMIYGIGSESAGYISKLRELGIKTIFNADYLETDPLAKAEWIRVFGALYGKQQEADSIFSLIETKYLALCDFIRKNAEGRPKVLLGLPFRDTWFISPGNSYISELIDDAGGEYLWSKTTSSVSMPIGIEKVFLHAMDADYWLNTGSASDRAEIEAIDSRLSGLPCFLKGNVFNNNKRINPAGGNDYWEGGSISPDILLRDVASVLHPELFPDYDLYYYKRLK